MWKWILYFSSLIVVTAMPAAELAELTRDQGVFSSNYALPPVQSKNLVFAPRAQKRMKFTLGADVSFNYGRHGKHTESRAISNAACQSLSMVNMDTSTTIAVFVASGIWALS